MAKSRAQFSSCIVLVAITAICGTCAADPAPLQDFCVGVTDPNAAILVNGLFCKNPTKVTETDFIYRGFNTPGDTKNSRLGTAVMMMNVTVVPALNTLGVSIARVDFAPGGVNPPHLHPRSSEILTVIEGTLYVGFITANQRDGSNRLFTTVLKTGDLFVFPQGLIHFQINVGKINAVANVAFGSQNPGVQTVGNSVFGSNPRIRSDILSKAFHVDDNVIKHIQSGF